MIRIYISKTTTIGIYYKPDLCKQVLKTNLQILEFKFNKSISLRTFLNCKYLEI
jgi:hypothetical protein